VLTENERIEYFKEEIARLSNELVDSLEQRDALAAQVEQLNFESGFFDVDVIRCLKTIAFKHNHNDIPRYMAMAKRCMDEISDKQSRIVAHDAEIAKAAFIAGVYFRSGNSVHEADLDGLAEQYANQLCQQAKGGE
jgi:chorismate mutase